MPKHSKPIPNRIYVHRRKASLTQRELAMLIGYISEGAVARHERFNSLPPFLTAISELFFGVRDTVESVVEERINDLRKSLEDRDARGKYAIRNARKLEWLTSRQT